jgi:zinc D-Ala-D-Ala carboxypeptidase
MTQLSAHFSLEELTHSDLASRKGWSNTPNDQEIANLKRLATMLEAVRTIIEKPIFINSGFRSKQVNDGVGSKDSSQHRLGCAADIRVQGMTPRQVVEKIRDSGLMIDQCILEWDAWVHLSVPNYEQDRPRRQFLTIDKQGTRPFA